MYGACVCARLEEVRRNGSAPGIVLGDLSRSRRMSVLTHREEGTPTPAATSRREAVDETHRTASPTRPSIAPAPTTIARNCLQTPACANRGEVVRRQKPIAANGSHCRLAVRTLQSECRRQRTAAIPTHGGTGGHHHTLARLGVGEVNEGA